MLRCFGSAVGAAAVRVQPRGRVVGRLGGVRRGMAGGGHGDFYISHTHANVGKFYMCVMWLWMMYRAKEDGMVKFLGYHPWDLHADDHHDDHDDHHDDHGEHHDDEDDEDDDE
mmetsp:Transcript_11366/g.34020  ORF Transcript_11366/g.34020 Transcript_11366/m.34020 type:complete len:113 (+) Transcript_11366:27-365(+)